MLYYKGIQHIIIYNTILILIQILDIGLHILYNYIYYYYKHILIDCYHIILLIY